MNYIPQDDQTRKDSPMFRGLLGYFPAALFEVAAHSLDSDRKHNPGNEDGPTWARGKSADHEDTILRHLIDAGPRRTSKAWTFLKSAIGLAPKGSSAKDARRYHLRCIAWRALALLQEDCEADGALPGVSSVPAAPPEEWGVFFRTCMGERRSDDLPGIYPSEAAADDAIRELQDGSFAHRYARRLS